MPKNLLHILLLFLTAQGLSAQDFNHYVPLKSQGEIPASILKRSSEKYEQERELLAQEGSQQERASKENFLLQSNFALDALLLSGRVLYNDPVGEYLNGIKDYLLRDLPDARDSIRVLVVRSPLVNAFCTNNGVVLVHMGLLAKVKNEAQLAYILCHEFQHFLEQHPITRFVEDEKRRSKLKIVDFDDYESYILAKNRYSREQELEADDKGIDLFLQSDYAASELDGTFDVMRYAYLPFENREWQADFFDSEHFWLPPDIHPDTIQAISAPEDYDDSKMSHPNISTRRSAVQERLEAENLEGEKYILGRERFENAQLICRFEMAHQYLSARSYERAIYQSYLLLQAHPRSYYLKRIIAQSLYGLVKYKNERSFYSVHEDYEDIEGNSQTLYFTMEKLDKEELNALALNYAWRQHQENPEDPALYAISLDLMDEFFGEHVEFVKQMNREPSEKSRAEVYPPWEEATEVESDSVVVDGKVVEGTEKTLLKDGAKLDRPMRHLDRNRRSVDHFLLNAFVDLFSDPEFEKEYERRLEEEKGAWDKKKGAWDKKKVAWEKENVKSNWGKEGYKGKYSYLENNPQEEEEDFQVKNSRRPSRLGVKKVLFISPFVKQVDERPSKMNTLIEEEKSMDAYSELIGEMADRVGLEYHILNAVDLDGKDVDRFNDMVTIREWVSENFSEDLDEPIINIHQEAADQVMEKYETDFIAINATIDFTAAKSSVKVFGLTFALLIPPFSPLVAYNMFRKESNFLYVNWVWNIKTGEMVLEETRFVKHKARRGNLKSVMYYSFLQIASENE